MRTIALVISLAFCSVIYSQVNIIPQPESVKMGAGTFMLTVNVPITTKANTNYIRLQKSSDFLAIYLSTYYRSWIGSSKKILPESRYNITLSIDESQNTLPESYTLDVNKNGIDISGHDE